MCGSFSAMYELRSNSVLDEATADCRSVRVVGRGWSGAKADVDGDSARSVAIANEYLMVDAVWRLVGMVPLAKNVSTTSIGAPVMDGVRTFELQQRQERVVPVSRTNYRYSPDDFLASDDFYAVQA